MIYLALSIIASTLVFVVFRKFSDYGIDNLQAIVINYAVAGTIGLILMPAGSVNELPHWYWLAIIQGFLFISLFNLMAYVAQQASVSVSSMANKMSVVIPAVASMYLWESSIQPLKIAALVVALIGVILTTLKGGGIRKNQLIWPLLLFIGSGVLDTLLKYGQLIMKPNEEALFSASIFFTAGALGFITLAIKKRTRFEKKNVAAGLILGLINYFTIFFILKTLGVSGMDASTIFPLNNVSIVLVSTMVSVVWFKEKLNLKNRIGIALSIVAVALLLIAL